MKLSARITSARCRRFIARWRLVPRLAAWLGLACLLGCSSAPRPAGHRAFQFATDTFAYANEVAVAYAHDAHGRWRGHAVEPEPGYTLHCFVVARSARQFFQHARFDPALSKASAAEYRRLVRAVVAISPRRDLPASAKVVIPGYPTLREFSREQEQLLKAECGSFWQSYFQCGNWRMVFPFTGGQRADTAARLAQAVRENRPPVVHLACFPSLRINHAVVLYEVEETRATLRFATYDPNTPGQAVWLTFHRADRTFTYPANNYFPGGRVDAYEVYCGTCY